MPNSGCSSTGAYTALPAGIWKGEEIPSIGEWIMYRVSIPREEYKALCKDFNPVEFDAEQWVKLAKAAGMKYIITMPKHYDGFAMYRSGVSDFNIYDATPFKRDPIQELYEACKKHRIRFGIYYSHATDWMDGGDARANEFMQEIEDGIRGESEFQMKGGRKLWPANDWDPADVTFNEYLENKSFPQVEELMKRYPDVKEVWFDMQRYITEEQSFDFYKLVYEHQPNCIINSRIGHNFGDFWIAGDNKIPDEGESEMETYWVTPGTMNNIWGYKSYDQEWKCE